MRIHCSIVQGMKHSWDIQNIKQCHDHIYCPNSQIRIMLCATKLKIWVILQVSKNLNLCKLTLTFTNFSYVYGQRVDQLVLEIWLKLLGVLV